MSPRTVDVTGELVPDPDGQPSRARLPLFSIFWMTVVWVLLWGTLDLMTLIGGIIVSFLLLWAFPLPRLEAKQRLHPWPFVVLVTRFLADVVVSSLHVAWLAIKPGPTPRGLVMDLQLRGDDELQQTLTCAMVTLVPGSVVIELDSAERIVTLHYIGIKTRAEAEAVRRMVLAQEARVIRALNPDPERILGPRKGRGARGEDLVPRTPEGQGGTGHPEDRAGRGGEKTS